MPLSLLTNNWTYLLIGSYPHGPLGGLVLTVLISLAAGSLASVLGVAWAIGLVQGQGWPAWILRQVCELLRAVPVLLLIFWMYFLLPILFGIDIPGVLTVITALALVSGAYLAYIIAGGMRALPRGQWEAAQASGLNGWQTLRFVILPQALRTMRPSIINQWVTLLKDTSLAYIVGVAELTFVANQINNRVQVYPLPVFAMLGLTYLLLCSSLQWLASRNQRQPVLH